MLRTLSRPLSRFAPSVSVLRHLPLPAATSVAGRGFLGVRCEKNKRGPDPRRWAAATRPTQPPKPNQQSRVRRGVNIGQGTHSFAWRGGGSAGAVAMGARLSLRCVSTRISESAESAASGANSTGGVDCVKGRANSAASDETEGQKCDRSVSTSQRHESKARQSRGSASAATYGSSAAAASASAAGRWMSARAAGWRSSKLYARPHASAAAGGGARRARRPSRLAKAAETYAGKPADERKRSSSSAKVARLAPPREGRVTRE
mmetsp:Transcript_49703/g.160737  ORF Transcript_49703/g.160737 Transcript_49703/m.160737 type:complete len:262 (+) Transcript_49703:998-1783(+)